MSFQSRLLTWATAAESVSENSLALAELLLLQEHFPLCMDTSCPEVLVRDPIDELPLPRYCPFLEQLLALFRPNPFRVGLWINLNTVTRRTPLAVILCIAHRYKILQERYPSDIAPAIFLKFADDPSVIELLPSSLLSLAVLRHALPDVPIYTSPGPTHWVNRYIEHAGVTKVSPNSAVIHLTGDAATYLHPLNVKSEELFLAPACA